MNPDDINRESLRWRIAKKSSTANCVEVARAAPDTVVVRNSRRPDGDMIIYPHADFNAFLAGVKSGEFDDLLH